MCPPEAPVLPSERTHLGGGRLIFVAQCVRLVVRIGGAAALARLLTPGAYGLHGMAAAVFGLLYMAKDFGIVTALQQPGINRSTFSALCRFGTLGGLGLALLGAALGIPTGWFFGERATVPWVLAAMSGTFVFTGLAAPALGLLYREQRSGLVAGIEAGAAAVSTLSAVAAAWAGWGVWSLVLLTVVNEFLICAAAWQACPWRPGSSAGATRWRELAGFGASLTGHNVAAYCTRILDQVTVGRAAGPAALGFYGRGAQIPALPAQFGLGPFHPWILATLSRHRDSPAEYVRFFRHALNGLLHVALLAAAVCVAVPELLLTVLFGAAWLPAAPVVRWLGVALAVQPFLGAPGWLLGASGHGRRLLAWSGGGAGLMAAGCLITMRSGMSAIAMMAGFVALVHAALAPWFCRGRTPVTTRDWFAPALLPLLVHGGLAVALFVVDRTGPGQSATGIKFSVLLAVGLVYFAVMSAALPRLRTEIRRHLFWSR